MKLEEFVSKTLVSVLKGVQSAQGEVKGTGAVVHMSTGTRGVHQVDFVVPVCEERSELVVGGSALGASSSNVRTPMCEVRFSVPVYFPVQQEDK